MAIQAQADLEIPMTQQPSSGDDAKRVDHIVEVAFNPVQVASTERDVVGRLARLGTINPESRYCTLPGCWQLVLVVMPIFPVWVRVPAGRMPVCQSLSLNRPGGPA